VRATDREFRHRFWLITAVFVVGFACSVLDRRSGAEALVRWLGVPAEPWVRAVLGAGALLTLIAAWLRTWASAYLRTTVVKDGSIHTDRLVADGPYRYVRNPLYLGTLLLAVSFGLLASPTGFVVMVGGMLLVVLRLVGREEAELVRAQGERYAVYRRAVPSLLPARRARVPASGARPAWRQAVIGELAMWAFGVGLAAFAVTRDQRLLFVFLVLGFIGYVPGRLARGPVA
jgi:protein-S-isoprenylcysteine O-methyltransferase Ste14